MLAIAHLTQFSHVAKNHHFVLNVHLHKILKRRFHARWVGIIGVHDNGVMSRFDELRAVVAGNVVFKSLTNVFAFHAHSSANAHCSQHVGNVISTDEMRTYVVPSVRFVISFFPSETNKRVVGSYFSYKWSLNAVGRRISNIAFALAMRAKHL